MAIDLKGLRDKISKNSDLEAGAKLLVHAVAGELANLTHDPVAIKAMADELLRDAGALAKALVDGTSPAPAPPTAPQTLSHQTGTVAAKSVKK